MDAPCCGDTQPATPTCQCCSAVVVVLHGAERPPIDPEFCLMNVLMSSDQAAQSRHHQPPVPPPMPGLLHIA